MQHFSEVLKILEGGLRFNAQTVVNYAKALKDKLEADGEHQQARLLQAKLDGASPTLTAYNASAAVALPVDQESQLDLATLERVDPTSSHAILDDHVHQEVDRFLSYVRASEKLVAEGVGIAPRMIIYGPPGVGKTQLARHIAAELKLPLLTARCDSLISSYLGSTAKNIRRLFDHAAERPCVLFLDEFDALAKARDDSQELGELKRVVVGLLQIIDSLPPQNVLLAATNHQQLLDPAVWRRFTYRLHLDLPQPQLREALLKAYLREFAPSDYLELAVKLSHGLSGAAIREVCEECLRGAVLAGETSVPYDRLIHRLAQTALVASHQAPTAEAVGRYLLAWKTPQRLVSAAADISMRQVAKLATQIQTEKTKGGDRHGKAKHASATRRGRSRA